ncbi:hypothetical protein [Nocardia transvalensis]|uniref:hypothetical protein n=1 Tax=Nocardia transvalensis TaxID=37333 RepID=UPI00189386D3|nr:hypothetical protein [Nocardia transvalensis]MBF6333618.1 hypothetical protein [Nocardia transvalensis]
MRTPIVTLATTLTATALIAGCGGGTNHTTDLTGGDKSTATTTDATDPKNTAADQTIAVVERYFQTLSRLDADYTVPVDAADDVASGAALNTVKADVTVRRSKGITITGDIKVVGTKVTDVRLTPPPATVQVRACVDTSSRDAKYPDGSSANAANRVPRQITQLTVENPAWPDPKGWRVAVDAGNRGGEACESA